MSIWCKYLPAFSLAVLALSQGGVAVAQSPDGEMVVQQEEGSYFPELEEDPTPLTEMERVLAKSLTIDGFRGTNRTKGLFQRAMAWEAGAVLKVCFLNGTAAQGRDVARIGSEWNFADSPLTLDFGDSANPRRCGSSAPDIRVAISAGPSWSKIGRYSRASSLVLGLNAEEGMSEAKRRQIILHEFGHALGLHHELKHAEGHCWDEFIPGKLKAFYQEEFGFSDEARIRDAIGTFDPVQMDSLVFSTAFDPSSVMMYSFPADLYQNKKASKCWSPVNSVLSDSDKLTLRLAYENPIVAASTIAGLSAGKGDEVTRLANAYNSILLADDAKREILFETAVGLPDGVTPGETADAILGASLALSIQRFGQQ